jgi:hypothetical protein
MAKDRDDDRDDRDDDRPRRRRDDDYDDRPKEQLGPLDKMFRDTNTVVLVLFGLCCGMIALVLGIVGMVTAKDAKAKSNATLVTIIAAVSSVIGVGANIFRFMNAAR